MRTKDVETTVNSVISQHTPVSSCLINKITDQLTVDVVADVLNTTHDT